MILNLSFLALVPLALTGASAQVFSSAWCDSSALEPNVLHACFANPSGRFIFKSWSNDFDITYSHDRTCEFDSFVLFKTSRHK